MGNPTNWFTPSPLRNRNALMQSSPLRPSTQPDDSESSSDEEGPISEPENPFLGDGDGNATVSSPMRRLHMSINVRPTTPPSPTPLPSTSADIPFLSYLLQCHIRSPDTQDSDDNLINSLFGQDIWYMDQLNDFETAILTCCMHGDTQSLRAILEKTTSNPRLSYHFVQSISNYLSVACIYDNSSVLPILKWYYNAAVARRQHRDLSRGQLQDRHTFDFELSKHPLIHAFAANSVLCVDWLLDNSITVPRDEVLYNIHRTTNLSVVSLLHRLLMYV
jgi:hypothetical protein